MCYYTKQLEETNHPVGSCRDRTQERDGGWEQRHYLKSRGRCLLALAAYLVKILLFSLSTGTSHAMAYTILEGLACGWRTAFFTPRWETWKTTPSARSRT